MGAWGSGNFHNDAALDYADEVKQEMVDRIEEILADPDRSALDEDGDGILMPTVQMLSVLHEQCSFGLPERETVQRWKTQFLAIFDDQIDGLEPKPGHKEARRAVIEATFLKLEAQAWDYTARQAWYRKPNE